MDTNRVVTFCAFIAHKLFRRDALVWKMHRQIQSYNPCFANKLLSSMYWELHDKLYLNFSSCFCIHLMYMLRTTQCTVCYSGFCFCIHLMYRLRTTQCTVCYSGFCFCIHLMYRLRTTQCTVS